MARMANLTSANVNEISKNNGKVAHSKQNRSAADSKGFLKIFEKANKNVNFTFEKTASLNKNVLNALTDQSSVFKAKLDQNKKNKNSSILATDKRECISKNTETKKTLPESTEKKEEKTPYKGNNEAATGNDLSKINVQLAVAAGIVPNKINNVDNKSNNKTCSDKEVSTKHVDKKENISHKKTENITNTENITTLVNKTTTNTEDLKDKKKIEVLIRNDSPEVNTDLAKQGNIQLSSSTHKNLTDVLNRTGTEKPVVTKLEVSNNLNNKSSEQKQKQNLMDSQAAVFTANSMQRTDTSNINIEKAVTFDKVMDAKQEFKIDPDSILNQISQKTSGEIKNGKSEITLSLRPEGLGKVDINVISNNGVITAGIIAENSQVKAILNTEIESLKQKMQENGINIDTVVVKVQEPAQTNNHSAFNHNLNNQTDNNTSNSSDSHLNKQAQGNSGQKYINYNQADFNEETNVKPETTIADIHQGLVDYTV